MWTEEQIEFVLLMLERFELYAKVGLFAFIALLGYGCYRVLVKGRFKL